MAIYKAQIKNQFTQIPNETLQDLSLSFEAKGVLVLILSLPTDWEIHKSWLQKQAANCGRDKLTRIIKELDEAGYVRKKPRQDKTGKMAGWDWFVYSTKQTQASDSKTSTETLKTRNTVKPYYGKPSTTNKQVNKKTETTTTTTYAEKKFLRDLAKVKVGNEYEYSEDFKSFIPIFKHAFDQLIEKRNLIPDDIAVPDNLWLQTKLEGIYDRIVQRGGEPEPYDIAMLTIKDWLKLCEVPFGF